MAGQGCSPGTASKYELPKQAAAAASPRIRNPASAESVSEYRSRVLSEHAQELWLLRLARFMDAACSALVQFLHSSSGSSTVYSALDRMRFRYRSRFNHLANGRSPAKLVPTLLP